MKCSLPETGGYEEIASVWGDYVDWEKRRQGENGFLTDVLRSNGCRLVLNAALGDGCDSVYLSKEGFDVISNEIDSCFEKIARANAERENVKLDIRRNDWRKFDEKFEEKSFDAVVLLGNSFTMMSGSQNQLRALSAFRNVLKPNGVLLVDERNYLYILSQREQILAGNWRYSKKYVYCGDKADGRPVEISDDCVVWKIEHENGKKAFLPAYPFKKGELRSLLQTAGFEKVEQYSDYKKGFDEGADFFQYVAAK